MPKFLSASLKVLDLQYGTFTGGIPAKWSLMTNLKELKMAYCGLDGETDFPGIPSRCHHLCLLIARAGELPLAIGQLKANGCEVDLSNNKGFTLSHDISSVADATKLDFSDCYLGGACVVITGHTAQKRIEKRIARAGPSLPETLQLLAPLASTLEVLDLGHNKLGGTVTPDIAVFTKLTKLRLSSMGLEGASLGIARYTVAR